MSDPIRVEFDLRQYEAAIAGIKVAADKGLLMILNDPAYAYVHKAQVYLTGEMSRALKENGDIAEGESRSVRGELWRGWAHWGTKKYDTVVMEGTRFYMRKYARGGTSKKLGATMSAAERRAGWGTKKKKVGMDDRPFEKVWRRRTGGSRYSESSKLMQDTGRMAAGLVLMKTAIVGGTVELRPGSNVAYFDRQNEMRPLWVVDPTKDEPVLRGFMDEALAKLAKQIEQGAV